MNMAQFANKVIGQPVTNWDASGTTLGFARGNVGFVALGDLGKDFNTGLPDGEYCDIIRDCSQKIQISGGRGYFQSPDDDPVVAICVGCYLSTHLCWILTFICALLWLSNPSPSAN